MDFLLYTMHFTRTQSGFLDDMRFSFWKSNFYTNMEDRLHHSRIADKK